MQAIMKPETFDALRAETSESFCLAKFHSVMIPLFKNQLAGCFHNPLTPLGTTVDTFYNTPERRAQQKEMVEGGRPSSCSYCWNIEDQGLMSDRRIFSLAFKDHQPVQFYKDPTSIFKPKMLEVSFQKTCNFACSYCAPGFSTSWANDIRVNGKYINLKTDTRDHFGLDQYNEPVDPKLFHDWLETVIEDIEIIRITGGEPLLHPELFQTLDLVHSRNPDAQIFVNTNLVNSPELIRRFIDKIQHFKNAVVYTSNESAGELSEFIRDGMVYSEWLDNIRALTGKIKTVAIMGTLSALSLHGLDEMLLDVFRLRKEGVKIYFTLNSVRYPEFQSFDALTKQEKEFYHQKYATFLDTWQQRMGPQERLFLSRMISELQKEPTEKQPALRQDLIEFFNQYTIRRNKKTNFVHLIGQ